MNQTLSPAELQKLETIERLVSSLRADATATPESFGVRMADKVATAVGSWRFLLGQAFCLVLYMIGNVHILQQEAFDPYPFILLNLCLSFQAAFTAPIILMAQNRADAKDRRLAKKSYRTIGHIEELVKILAQMEGVATNGDQSSTGPLSDPSTS